MYKESKIKRCIGQVKRARMNLQEKGDKEVHVEPLLVEHEPQVFKINRSNCSSTIEGVSRVFKCDIHHTQ
jgi:hypothetical protein